MTDKLIVFLRRPVIGSVKSRLAADVGEAEALHIYKWLLEKCYASFRNLPISICVYFDEDGISAPHWAQHYQQFIQSEGDLGKRMDNAFTEQLDKNESGRIVLIGSDCPDLSQSILETAFSALIKNDIVIGPSFDGGFYLIGMKTSHKILFDTISWGGNKVFSEIEKKFLDRSLIYYCLPKLRDIDTLSDFSYCKLEYQQSKGLKTSAT